MEYNNKESKMWTEKHKPKRLEEFVGNAAVEFMKVWDGKPLMLHGGTGTGKSLLIELAAKERAWDIFHVDDDNMETALFTANTSTLFGNRKLLVVDNVDNIRDLKKIAELIKESRSPLILTTDDYGSKRLSTIKRSCQDLQLRRPMTATVAKYLAGIASKEGFEASKEVLEAIAKNSAGDFRGAINDLETVARGKKTVTEKDLEVLAARDKSSDIYKALSIIFGGRDMKETIEATWDLDEQPKDVIWWVEENIPVLYKDKQAVSDAFHYISRADVFLGRIMNRQYWGFLRYANPLMTAGVNVSRPETVNFTRYQPPSYFMNLGRSKGIVNAQKSIAEKMKPVIHASTKVIRREYIPLLKLMLKKEKISAQELKEQLFLEDEELDYLLA